MAQVVAPCWVRTTSRVRHEMRMHEACIFSKSMETVDNSVMNSVDHDRAHLSVVVCVRVFGNE